MQIQPTGIQTNCGVKFSPNFKSCYPVTHWVAETNGSYAPVLTVELAKKLQGILVRFLNAPAGKYSDSKEVMSKQVKNYIASKDKDYRNMEFVRSFYDKKGGWIKDKITPVAYMLTGADARYFDQKYGLPIGEIKRASSAPSRLPNSAELNMALNDYFRGGLQFVKSRSKEFCDINKMPYGLHAKFETIRSRTGNIKGFKLMGLGFYPEEGPNNPFVKLMYPPLDK